MAENSRVEEVIESSWNYRILSFSSHHYLHHYYAKMTQTRYEKHDGIWFHADREIELFREIDKREAIELAKTDEALTAYSITNRFNNEFQAQDALEVLFKKLLKPGEIVEYYSPYLPKVAPPKLSNDWGRYCSKEEWVFLSNGEVALLDEVMDRQSQWRSRAGSWKLE